MKPSTQIKSWCKENGWSDPFWHEGNFWAFPPFPPGAVMPLPVPEHNTWGRTTEATPERRTCLEGMIVLGFYFSLIGLDLLLLVDLTLAFSLVLGAPWGDRFSLPRLVMGVTLALFCDYILVSSQSQIRFFPFYDRLASLRESLWITWVLHSPSYRKLSSLCSKGLVGENFAFLLAQQIWRYRLVFVVPRQRYKAQEKVQQILGVMQGQGLECGMIRSYLNSLQVTQRSTSKSQ